MALVAGLSVLSPDLTLQPPAADAARDERTISLYEIHLKETTTVTYKRDGKYIPAALKKLNWAMRDWRTSATTKMDPKLFDLVWQLHKDSGSQKPVHVISGHRSAKTNRRLRKRGGGQAKKSQHVRGRAMDIHFPDVPMSRVRKAAFVHEVGGVGYYPTSALPFIHVDTARVRAWPRMGRQQLAMLFPYGATKHRPSSGGPLTARDRKKARIRLARLDRKKRTRTQLASASIPRTARPGKQGRSALTPSANRPVVLASLGNNGYGTMEIPGVSRHANKLWINKPGNTALPEPVQAKQSPAQNRLASYALASGPAAKGQSVAISRPLASQPKATLQLASLTPENNRPKRSDHRSNLWVNGSGLRADWLSDQPKTTLRQKSVGKLMPPAPKRQVASLGLQEPSMPQKPVQHRYGAERVSYAPSFDEEHPDELSYRPFQILPLMSSKPVAQNKSLVAMVEPKYDLIHELLLSSENIPMQFRPSSLDAQRLWNSRFNGNAILNIRKHTQAIQLPARPQRVAQR